MSISVGVSEISSPASPVGVVWRVHRVQCSRAVYRTVASSLSSRSHVICRLSDATGI